MLTDIRDGLVKVWIHHRWHRNQQMPSHMGDITHLSSIVLIGSRHKYLSVVSLLFDCHYRPLNGGLTFTEGFFDTVEQGFGKVAACELLQFPNASRTSDINFREVITDYIEPGE